MKYTIFAFQLHRTDLTDDRGNLTTRGKMVSETKQHRVDICDGVYVFDTQKGWSDMQKMRTSLMGMRQTFVELPFEQALAGFFPDDVCNKLREIGKSNGQGISLLNFNPEAQK